MPWPRIRFPRFGGLFKAPPAPPAPRRIVLLPPSGETWRAGDIAECIHPGPWIDIGMGTAAGIGPVLGERYPVVEVRAFHSPATGQLVPFLVLVRFSPMSWEAAAFRKVVPVADQQVAAEPAFLDDLIGAPAPDPATARPEPVEEVPALQEAAHA